MPISKLTGPMLSNILVRDGEGIAFSNTANSTPLLYIDIANSRIGVNTDTPTTDFTINGPGFANSFNLVNSLSLGGNVVAIGNVLANNMSAGNNITTLNLTATGNIDSSNVFAANNINSNNVFASNNINAVNMFATANVNTGNITATGFANAVNISASGNINSFANITAGNNITAAGVTSTVDLNVTGTANINSLNVANLSVSGNISGNISTSTTGNVTAGNITVANTATLGNIVIVDTTISSVGNVVIFAGTQGIAVPVGNLAQRPANVPAGTTRFNTTNDSLETWDGADWISTAAQPSTIYDQQITGTGVTTYTLDYYTPDNNNLIVSINGITQRPGAAYNVVGNDIVFGAALETTDEVDIRYITNPTDVPAYGNANVAAYLPTYAGSLLNVFSVVSSANVRANGILRGGNIRSDGTVSAVGNIIAGSGNFFIGDGSQLTNLPVNNYSNSNVAAYLPTYTGNVTAATIIANTVTSTQSLRLAVYADNTARDAAIPVPAAGMLIFNTAAASFQGYDGTAWGTLTLS